MSALRPYQLRAVYDLQVAFATSRTVLLQLPCGSGKTATIATGLLAPSVERGHRCVFLAGLEELLDDTAERLASLGLRVGIVQAGRRGDLGAPIQVASLWTLARRPEALPAATRVVLDEARCAAAGTVRRILARYPEALVCGLEAVPCRGDGQALSEFEALVRGPSIRELVELGHLVPTRVFAPDRWLERGVAEDPVEVVLGRAVGRRCAIFAPSAHLAREAAARLSALGHQTEAILDETPKSVRRTVRARLASGETRHLATVAALRAGFDAPVLDCAVLAQGCSSLASYLQSIGRVQRPCPETGKRDAWVFDLRGAVYLHGLPDEDRAWSLEGTQGKAGTQMLAALRRCAECHAVCVQVARCPQCGARLDSVDPRPLRVQRTELWDQRGVSDEERVRRWVDGAVRAMRMRKPGLSEEWCRRQVLRKPPAWARKALGLETHNQETHNPETQSPEALP